MFDMKTLYINQPLREYRLAFDLVANHVNSSTRKSLCLFSSASHAVELLKRCPCTLDMVGIGSFDVCEFVAEVDGWAWDGIQAVELDKLLPSYDKIVWIEPEEFQVESVFHQLRELADKNTKILIINRGPLMNVLPACKVQIQPVERPLSHRNLNQILNATGWQVESIRVFHGPRSIVWSFLHRASNLVKRPDWGDRFVFAMRNSFQEPGWIWWLSTLTLTCARVA